MALPLANVEERMLINLSASHMDKTESRSPGIGVKQLLEAAHFLDSMKNEPRGDIDSDADFPESQNPVNLFESTEHADRFREVDLTDGKLFGAREAHNKLEKNRRAYMRECFDYLRARIPALDARKFSNLSILHSALKIIQLNRRMEKEYECDLRSTVKQQMQLQTKIDAMVKELNDMDVDVGNLLSDTADSSTNTATETGSQLDSARIASPTGSHGDSKSGTSSALSTSQVKASTLKHDEVRQEQSKGNKRQHPVQIADSKRRRIEARRTGLESALSNLPPGVKAITLHLSGDTVPPAAADRIVLPVTSQPSIIQTSCSITTPQPGTKTSTVGSYFTGTTTTTVPRHIKSMAKDTLRPQQIATINPSLQSHPSNLHSSMLDMLSSTVTAASKDPSRSAALKPVSVEERTATAVTLVGPITPTNTGLKTNLQNKTVAHPLPLKLSPSQILMPVSTSSSVTPPVILAPLETASSGCTRQVTPTQQHTLSQLLKSSVKPAGVLAANSSAGLTTPVLLTSIPKQSTKTQLLFAAAPNSTSHNIKLASTILSPLTLIPTAQQASPTILLQTSDTQPSSVLKPITALPMLSQLVRSAVPAPLELKPVVVVSAAQSVILSSLQQQATGELTSNGGKK